MSLRDQLQKDEEIAHKRSILQQADEGLITLSVAERTVLELDLKALTRTTKRLTIGDICVVEDFPPGAERDACKIVKDLGVHSLTPYGVQWLEIRVSGSGTSTTPGSCRVFTDGPYRSRKLQRRPPNSEFAVLDGLREEQLRAATAEEQQDYEALEQRVLAREKRRIDVEDFCLRNRRILHPRCHADHLEIRFLCGTVARDPGKKAAGGY